MNSTELKAWVAEDPEAPVSSDEIIWEWLRQGWSYRWRMNAHMQAHKEEYAVRIKYEMVGIIEKRFTDYFLMLSDVVRFAKDSGIPVGPARGSAAASLVCYMLRITEVDPMQFPFMIFERFIDTNRTDLPDVDLDFDDELRYKIRDHLVDMYGAERVGNLGNYTRYRGKNSLVDVCRVYGIPRFAEEIVKNLVIERSGGDSRFNASLEDTFEMFPQAAEQLKRFPNFANAMRLEGNYKALGVHACGLVVCNSPVNDFVATYSRVVKGHKVEVVSVDKEDAEHLNLLKADFLSLTTLGMISHALATADMTLEELYKIPLDEPETLAAFRRNDVIGIFQFEGRATRLVNADVVPENFSELTDVNTLSRPGPLFSSATHRYVDTKHGRQESEHLHPLLDEITAHTQYQIIYQEQILLICGVVGDLGWVHRNAIRKIISAKKGEAAMNALQGEFVTGAARKGVDRETALAIWARMVTAGTYAFCTLGDTLVYRPSVNIAYGDGSIMLKDLYRRIHPPLLDAQRPGPNYVEFEGPCVACGEYADKPFHPGKTAFYRRGLCGVCITWRDAYAHRGLKILSMDDDERIRPNDILDIHSPVERPLFKVTTESGRNIRVSEEHRFYTPNGYKFTYDLRAGDEITMMGEREETPDDQRMSTPKSKGHHRILVDAKAVVLERSKGVCEHCIKSKDKRFEYAHIMTLTDLDGVWEKYHNPANLLYLCNSCHKKFDYANGTRKKRDSRGRLTETDIVASVERDGIGLVYDVSMAGPSHNYIGNEFVNHNNVAHAVSYTMIAFWQMWLKVHRPLAFYAAALRKTPKEKWGRLIKDARRHGIDILPPDLNKSGATWSPDKSTGCVLAGFEQIPGIGDKTSGPILEERDRLGGYADWNDLGRIKGIGPKTIANIRAFAESDDPFKMEETRLILEEIRGLLNKRALGPIPRQTHGSEDMPPDMDQVRVVFVGRVKKKNYQDYVENQRARTGEEVEDIIARMDNKDKVTSCVVHCYDEGDEDVYLRFERRHSFPNHKRVLEGLRTNGDDVVVAMGVKRAGFGVVVQVQKMWVIATDEDDDDDASASSEGFGEESADE